MKCKHKGGQRGQRNGVTISGCMATGELRGCTDEPNEFGLATCTGCPLFRDADAPIVFDLETIYLPERNSTRAVVTLAVGKQFQELLSIARPTFRAYAEKCGADYIEVVMDGSPYAQGEKLRFRQLFDHGYNEVMFIDADCIVMDAPNLFDLTAGFDVAILDDIPRLKDKAWVSGENQRITDSQGWAPAVPTTCYNTGVMLLRDRRALDLPTIPIPTTHLHKTSPQGHFIEQALINCNIHRHELKVFQLGEEWNRQWWVRQSLPVIPGTWIYHWSSVPHKVRVEQMLQMRDGAESPWPIGDHIATALTTVGITKERVSAWLGRPCNCPERQKKLNDLGAWAAGFAKGLFGRADVEKIVA